MDIGSWWVAALVALAVSGCAMGPEGGRSAEKFSIKLKASARNPNQSEIASASFAPQGDITAMLVDVSGVPSGFALPVRLYTFIYQGSCDRLAASPAYDLNAVVPPSSGPPFTLNRSVPLPLAQLRSGGYSVVIRASPADGNMDLFCGEIR